MITGKLCDESLLRLDHGRPETALFLMLFKETHIKVFSTRQIKTA